AFASVTLLTWDDTHHSDGAGHGKHARAEDGVCQVRHAAERRCSSDLLWRRVVGSLHVGAERRCRDILAQGEGGREQGGRGGGGGGGEKGRGRGERGWGDEWERRDRPCSPCR